MNRLKSVITLRCELLSNFLYFCSRNNLNDNSATLRWLWIALKFFVLLQSKQLFGRNWARAEGCELLSNFLYFCSRNNIERELAELKEVVNCSQIFCTFAVETTNWGWFSAGLLLWIALKFFVLLQSKQLWNSWMVLCSGCELLSNFLYFCSRNNSVFCFSEVL